MAARSGACSQPPTDALMRNLVLRADLRDALAVHAVFNTSRRPPSGPALRACSQLRRARCRHQHRGPFRRVQRVDRQQAARGLVLQIKELAFAMAQIRLQQAAAYAFRQRDGPGIEQQHQCAPAARVECCIRRVLTSTGSHRRTRQIAGRAASRQQPRKARARRMAVHPATPPICSHIIGIERRGIAAGGGDTGERNAATPSPGRRSNRARHCRATDAADSAAHRRRRSRTLPCASMPRRRRRARSRADPDAASASPSANGTTQPIEPTMYRWLGRSSIAYSSRPQNPVDANTAVEAPESAPQPRAAPRALTAAPRARPREAR
jgi:hypothetical protein